MNFGFGALIIVEKLHNSNGLTGAVLAVKVIAETICYNK
jgi:hypothetical protein